jgi:hypothetical protein
MLLARREIMSKVLAGLFAAVAFVAATAEPGLAQQFATGYTYVAPSYYLTPPVLTVPPGVVLGPGPVMMARPVYAPVVPVQPSYFTPAVVPYTAPAPAQAPPPPLPSPSFMRQRVHTSPRGTEYKVKTYTPAWYR